MYLYYLDINGINWKRSARQNQNFRLGKGAISAKTFVWNSSTNLANNLGLKYLLKNNSFWYHPVL